MAKASSANLAEQAADKALAAVYECIDKWTDFRLEAGAGAGKTYSLIKALHHVIAKNGAGLLRKRQRVACITYTNVARDEIESRTDGHPAVLASTIHSFCWSLIKDFQPFLKKTVPALGKWSERLDEVGGLGNRFVTYDLGYPTITEEAVCLAHADVLSLAVAIMEESKFRKLLTSRYPILFIDEYQDTNKDFALALQTHFFGAERGPLIGLFGDHWQKIYGDGCGAIEHEALAVIDKGANFRSTRAVVDVLNRMRPELPQALAKAEDEGEVSVYHTNDWTGSRRTESQWRGDMPSGDAHKALVALKHELAGEGWDFSPENTKILMLTHNVLAMEQGYKNLADVFRYNDQFIKKENDHIAFFVDTLEPMCVAYEDKRFGELFTALGVRRVLQSKDDKAQLAKTMDELCELRRSANIGRVVDHVQRALPFIVPERVVRRERELHQYDQCSEEDEPSALKTLRALREVDYKEVSTLALFIDGHTPFSTKHGVKGAEFENVLVVMGRGWNWYNFDEMLRWVAEGVPSDKKGTFERNRNLFYVVCSRPKRRLALLFTQELSGTALGTLRNWFGSESIRPVPALG